MTASQGGLGRTQLILLVGGIAILVGALVGGGVVFFIQSSTSGSGIAQTLGIGKTSPSPTAAHQPLLFAVLEQKSGQPNQFPPLHDTVAIVNLSGNAVAKQTFSPRTEPNVGPAAPLLQPEARTAAGMVFYADGKGVIRALKPSGSLSTAATITVNNPQQELAFAVSPDGKTIDATVLTFPAVVSPAPGAQLPFAGPGPGPLHLDLFQAQVGGGNRKLINKDIPQQPLPAPVLQMVGWDSTGPIATDKTELGTQNPPGGSWYGEAHHLDGNGNFISAAEFGGAGCRAQGALPDATALCVSADFKTVSVRSASAQILWTLPAAPADQPYFGATALSPDGGMVAVGAYQPGSVSGIYKKAGGAKISFTGAVAGFLPEGWLDNDTVIGTVNPNGSTGVQGEMWLVHASSPGSPVDLGFKGNFAGVVQPAT